MDTRNSSRGVPPDHRTAGTSGRAWWALCGIAAVIAVLFILENRPPLAQGLTWLILLACPLLHVFLHGGHGGHAAHGDEPRSPPGKHGP